MAGTNAVVAYVQGLLQDMVGAYGNTPMVVCDDPPQGELSIETPIAYILDAEGDGKRQTMAYTSGFYEEDHQVYLMIQWALAPNSLALTPSRSTAFRNLIDTAVATIRTSFTGAIPLIDPATGDDYTQLLASGQNLKWRTVPPEATESSGQTWLTFTCQITFTTTVKVQYVGEPSSMDAEVEL